MSPKIKNPPMFKTEHRGICLSKPFINAFQPAAYRCS
uniref:Uncharacterized protein n=1 Tax=Caudovirales sp. ctTVN2 TaxID=2827634 RepID=A0A8S5S8M5_9CAUD|nr:MAG TPA: hypothetical protein [Caudovirales sp. ctTVN2]